MKSKPATIRILSYLFLFVLLAVTGHPLQAQAPKKVIIPAEVFPLMGFEFWSDTTTTNYNYLKDSYINTMYDGSADASRNGSIKGGMRVVQAFNEGESDDTGLTPNRTFIGGHENANVSDASELRYFLAANEGKIIQHSGIDSVTNYEYAYDIRHNWARKVGISVANKEWLIDQSVQLSDGYILDSLDINDQYLTSPERTDSDYCSFVYRLTGDGATSTTPLFQVEYTLEIHKDDGNLTLSVPYSFDTLTYARFLSYTGLSHPNEHPHILTFPNLRYGKLLGGLTAQKYAVVYRTIPTHPADYPGYYIRHIYCSVKRLASASIYVRGLRIRSWLAERTLTNDAATIAEFKRLCLVRKNKIDALSGQWKNTLYLAAGAEPQGPLFRVIAHVDQICWKYIGRHIIPFLANNTPNTTRWSWYRSIYEDETDSVPPPISAENLEYGDSYDSTNHTAGQHFAAIPSDAVDYIFREMPGRRKDLLPVTGDTISEGGTSVYHDYNLYTHRMQNHLDVFNFYNAALGACPRYATPDRYGPCCNLF
jgi:hypothetical protein